MYRGATALCDAFFAAGTGSTCNEYIRVATLFFGHRLDNGFDGFKGIITDVHIFDGLAHTRDHGHQVFDITHFFHLLQLRVKILEVELVLANLLVEALSFFLIKHLLGFLYQRNHIAHAEDTAGHTVGIEGINSFHLFACTYKLNRFFYYGTNRERRPTARIAVQLGKHHARKVQAVVEGLGGIDGILSRHGIYYKEDFLRIKGFFYSRNLLHHFLIYSQASGSIHNHNLFVGSFGMLQCILGNLHRIFIVGFGIYFHADLLAQYFELLDGRRAIHVAGSEEYLAVLFFEIVGQLARKGRFTGTL